VNTATVIATSRSYRSERRNAQARQTRARVLAVAAELFLERGYAAATMREVAARSRVSLPTVELLFGRKGRLLKAAIDVAIAGDDEPVGVLDRPGAEAAAAARTPGEFLARIAAQLGPAQHRSAGLVLATFEGAAADGELAELVDKLVGQRARTAAWVVERLAAIAPLRADCSTEEAVDTVWLLMDPAIFSRLTLHRRWTVERYQLWFASSVARLLLEPSNLAPS
jgi:AcrR family transcriptional regulator